MNTTSKLRKITQDEFNDALEQHFLYQKGDESKRMIFKDCDFSGIRIIEKNLNGAIFDGSDFHDSLAYSTGVFGKRVFYYCTLDNVSFRNCNFDGIDFDGVDSMAGAVLIGAKFKSDALGKFKDSVIVTNEQLQEILKKSLKQEEIIIKQDKQIEEKDEALEKTSEKQSKNMLIIFDDLRRDFSFEERLWLIFAFYVFLILFGIASSLVGRVSIFLAAYANIVLLAIVFMLIFIVTPNSKEKDEKPEYGLGVLSIVVTLSTFAPVVYFSHEAYMMWIKKPSEWVNIVGGILNLESLEHVLPISLILLSILWFSVHQYGRAKKLRIEQQNKQAMIHFMQAIIASDGKGSNEDRIFPQLAPFFANTIIHRPFSQDNYDPQLPIDEVKKVIDMAKLFQK